MKHLFLLITFISFNAFTQPIFEKIENDPNYKLADEAEMDLILDKEGLEKLNKLKDKLDANIENSLELNNFIKTFDMEKEESDKQEFLMRNFAEFFKLKAKEGMTRKQLWNAAEFLTEQYISYLTGRDGILEPEIQEKVDKLNAAYLKSLDEYVTKYENFDKNGKPTEEVIQFMNDKNKIHFVELKTQVDIEKVIKTSELVATRSKEVDEFKVLLYLTIDQIEFNEEVAEKKTTLASDSRIKLYIPKDLSKDSMTEDKIDLKDKKVYVFIDSKFADDDSDNPTRQKKAKGRLYFSWGYNRALHSKSDATFATKDGTFTVHDAHGNDRPSPFGIWYFNPQKLSIPQYNVEVGYMFNEKWGIELGQDHMKWVFDPYREYKFTGNYDQTLWVDDPTVVNEWGMDIKPTTFEDIKNTGDATWLRFEHTDGYNYVHVSAIYNQKIYYTRNRKFRIDAKFDAGAGLMIPKTNVNFRQGSKWNYDGIDNRFHIAGVGVSSGVRLKFTFWDRLYVQAAIRGTYIKINNALVDTQRDPDARLEHSPIGSVQFMGQIGYELPVEQFANMFRKKSNRVKINPGF